MAMSAMRPVPALSEPISSAAEDTDEEFISLSAFADEPHVPASSSLTPSASLTQTDEEPWACPPAHLQGLSLTECIHEELLRFCAFVSPTEAEHAARMDLIERVRTLVEELLPGAEVVVFGSVATRLYLPVSDLDLVIMHKGADTQQCLRKIAEEVQTRDLVSYVELILSAKVPIIKFTDALTKIRVDICFNVENGLEACRLINQFQMDMPALRPLTLFLKYFLQFREMNETYSGGIGSFLLQMMIVNHLQCHPYGSLRIGQALRSRDLNLGALLLSFLELYGKTFNYAAVGISVRNGGQYYSKVQRRFDDPLRPYLLSVENPLEPEIDVGRNSYGIMRVRRAFAWAHDRLICPTSVAEQTYSVLGRVIAVRGDEFIDRTWVTEDEPRRKSDQSSKDVDTGSPPNKRLTSRPVSPKRQRQRQG